MERHIEVEKMDLVINLFGSFDENVKIIEKELDVAIINRGSEIKIGGEPDKVEKAVAAVNQLLAVASRGETIGEQEVRYVMGQIDDGKEEELADLGKDVICITSNGTPLKAKTLGQKQYVEMIKKNPIVFGIGPAGTGKTYLAVAMAVSAFKNKEVNRIVLTRPAIEAGEINEDYAELNEMGEICLGDIVISLERAEEQAEEYGHSFEREVGFLTVHSMLHLLGFDHMTEEEEKEMFDYQREILEQMELTR